MSKDIIKKWIISHLSIGKRGFKTKFDLSLIFLLIVKRLKTGCQWRELPVEVYFKDQKISYQTVYYYFNKWSKDGSFKRIWLNLLLENRRKLDLSSVQLDGSHTRCRMGGQSVGYQLRKKSKTTNSIFLCDNLGQILAMGSPKSGNHHDLNDIDFVLKEILNLLEEAKIEHKGLFVNADAGFDSRDLKSFLQEKEIIPNIKQNPRNGQNENIYFDEELYKNRFKIERSFAWLDGFKGLIIRYETLNTTWMAMLYLGIILTFIRKV
ncbi:IS5/IS1182 family transposase [Capnocytophaga stomatis]|uniref:IS5/IS1182 family transposase n=1 Tax=Capnocytophaga stomatis TaxID=1848904 RepID=A0A250FUT8_9FLAO|nr:IS5 family transposase [Capnocytophaga stomatis]ATA88640.1 IS5/IS1182 family transposase [Capnocytophaga stomatis]ATA88880.1 IS5/IS1182 family transposase [Capnocytophaga stomatis]ATA89357.1 IS5/IS1182 family transposase [Capnocytophaga stomatis]